MNGVRVGGAQCRNGKWLILLMALMSVRRPRVAGSAVFEYPTAVLDLYDADDELLDGNGCLRDLSR